MLGVEGKEWLLVNQTGTVVRRLGKLNRRVFLLGIYICVRSEWGLVKCNSVCYCREVKQVPVILRKRKDD